MGCYSSASLKKTVDNSLHVEGISTVAVLPFHGVKLPPAENRQLAQSIADSLKKKNPRIKIVEPAESIGLINSKQHQDTYNALLQTYISTGVPDRKKVQELGKSLGADAFMQGIVFDVRQAEGSFHNYAGTHLTVRCVLRRPDSGTELKAGDVVPRAFGAHLSR